MSNVSESVKRDIETKVFNLRLAIESARYSCDEALKQLARGDHDLHGLHNATGRLIEASRQAGQLSAMRDFVTLLKAEGSGEGQSA